MRSAVEMSQNEQFPEITNELFARLFELYGVLDNAGRVIEISGSIFDRTSTEPQLLQNQVFSETAFWQSSEANSRAVTVALNKAVKGSFARLQAQFRVSSKEKLPVELNFIPAGTDQRIYVCARLIDTAKYKKPAPDDAAAHLLFAAESAGIGLWYLNFGDGRIRSTHQFSDILGLDPDKDLSFTSFLSAVHPDDRDTVGNFFTEAIRSGDHFEHAFRVVSVDGQTEWVVAEGTSFLTRARDPERLVGIVRRITEEKRAAEELEIVYEREKAARDEAELANRSKDIFLAFVSHELRAPLNSILGWSNILLTKEVDDKTRLNAIETIERSARMQTKLINDLVDSARVASGKIKLEYRPTDVISVVRNVVDAQRPALESRGLAYRTEFSAEKAYVMGDVNRLQQVFGNLLSNAIKFTPSGGSIAVTATKTDSEVKVVIADSGEGISADSLPTIFKQFSQVGAGEKKSVGLGLGLSIAKTLVERHGGTVYAESDGVGKGSQFVVSLPVLQSANLERTSESLRKPVSQKLLQGLTILIVEDEHDSREVLRLYLENKGATVHQAENVAAALRILEGMDSVPNLIVSDIGMPEEDGLSFIRRVRSSGNAEIASTPAIALSAFASGEFKLHALEAGFHRYVAKPFEPQSFAQSVIEVAQKNKA
jgi:PAS domain S-box-containing protein